MKYDESRVGSCGLGSPPSRGAWIEIKYWTALAMTSSSPPSRGAWIEIGAIPHRPQCGWSPPSRGAWIEIMKCLLIEVLYAVAPLAGGVK